MDSRQRSCRSFLTGRTNGAINPKGSYTEDATERTPRRVSGLFGSIKEKPKVSDSTDHWIPRACSMGSSS